MIYDRFRKKSHRPTGGGSSSLATADISEQVPETDDILAEIDKALETAGQLEEQLRPQDRCSC
jgi:hypothetical protein